MKKTILFAVVLASILVTGCRFIGKRIRGNGVIKTEERSVSPFKSVEASGAIKLMVSQGDLKPVKLEGDENILPYVEIRQNGDEIEIGTRRGYNLSPSNDLIVYVTAPVYDHIEVSGASDIKGQTKIVNPDALSLEASGAGDIEMEVDAPKIDAGISGSGSIRLKGQTKELGIDLSGAGHAYCFDLLSENTKVDISGAGSAEVYASVKLQAEVSGVGNVRYKGNAQNVTQQVSGAGSVSKEE
ncbi:MAG TPA: head GIN domain-containing protein [Puia sp.]|nr:head GIN domain-containing protein [Puia sp.]